MLTQQALVYKLLIEAENIPKQSLYLIIRLQIERDKFVDWAILANLSENERTLNSGLQLNQHKVNGALQEIRLVLLDLAKLTAWHDATQTNVYTFDRSLHDSSKVSPLKLNSSLQKKAITFAERTRIFPQKIRWNNFDSKAFELLLAKLAALNQNLTYFFEQRQQELHSQMQENAFMGILQASNSLDSLQNVMASLRATSLYRAIPAHEQQLLQLARFKAFQSAVHEAGDHFDEIKIRDYINDPAIINPNGILLDERRFIDGERDSLSEYEPARSWGAFNTLPVWIEWKYCEDAPFLPERQPPAKVLSHD